MTTLYILGVRSIGAVCFVCVEKLKSCERLCHRKVSQKVCCGQDTQTFNLIKSIFVCDLDKLPQMRM